MQPKRDAAYFNTIAAGHLPELLGIAITEAEPGKVLAHVPVRKALFAPNGFLHAGTVVRWRIPPAATDAWRAFPRARAASPRSN